MCITAMTSNGNYDPPSNWPNLSGIARVAAFRQCNPPVYDGLSLGMGARSWLYGMQALLQAAEFPTTTWVPLAVTQLTGEALVWWHTAGYSQWSTSWVAFSGAFLTQFVPEELLAISAHDQETIDRYVTLDRAIANWGITEG